jgi:hypothetical protein
MAWPAGLPARLGNRCTLVIGCPRVDGSGDIRAWVRGSLGLDRRPVLGRGVVVRRLRFSGPFMLRLALRRRPRRRSHPCPEFVPATPRYGQSPGDPRLN